MCGSGECGQLGLGPAVLESKRPRRLRLPAPLPALKHGVASICCGGMHTLALVRVGAAQAGSVPCLAPGLALFSFGCNDDGALGRGGDEDVPLPISFGRSGSSSSSSDGSSSSSCDGSSFTAGARVAMSCGDSHSAVLVSDSQQHWEVFVWGTYRDANGSLGIRGDGDGGEWKNRLDAPHGMRTAICEARGPRGKKKGMSNWWVAF